MRTILTLSLLLGAVSGAMEPPNPRALAVALATETLARELRLEPREVRVVEVKAAEWQDSSLGCPQPGKVYTPAAVKGFRLELAAGGARWEVRVAGRNAVVCGRSKGLDARLAPDKSAAPAFELQNTARQDLARRLGIAPGEIVLRSVRRVTWPDEGLGCGAADLPPQPTDGFAIELEAGGARYAYHTDARRVLLCEPPVAGAAAGEGEPEGGEPPGQ